MAAGYDIIGDIHGHATRLERLLSKLGYRQTHGHYAHPLRQAVFLGDYIDRGPEIRRVLQIVRAMVVAGTGRALMGNHEFNALAYNTCVPGRGWLREHDAEHARQYAETSAQVAVPCPDEWVEWLNWFSGLPLLFEDEGIRVVHASWHPGSTHFFRHRRSISRDLLASMADDRTPAGNARERLLSGVRIALPQGHRYLGRSGEDKYSVRVKWWIDCKNKSYREVALPSSEKIPAIPIPDDLLPVDHSPYAESEPPVLFGHYWLPPTATPEPVAPNIACLDYSVAAGGPLVAYSWNGERRLRRDAFVLA
jgi:Calcineurin-like phosphoesterase